MNKYFITIFLLGNVLLQYSQSSFIIGDTISSGIWYNNISDTVLPFINKGTSFVEFDIDNDGISDLKFLRKHNSSPNFNEYTHEIQSLDSVQLIRTLSDINNCDSLNINDTIKISSNWNLNFNKGTLFYGWYGPPPPLGTGNYITGVCVTNDTYIGFRKINFNDTIYGWFLLDMYGTYKIKSYAVFGTCYSINLCASVKEYSNTDKIAVFPNPVLSYLNIQYDSNKFTNAQVQIIDKLGQIVILNNENDQYINVSSLAGGIYTLKIYFNSGECLISKFVKENL